MRAVFALLLTAPLAACSANAGRAPEAVVTDSAGVRFVTHPAWEAAPFQLVPGSTRTLEVAEGSLPLFRVQAGAIGPDGDVFVADAGNYRVVRWSSAGEQVGTFGSQGDGPGEFQSIGWMHPVGSALAVYDSRLLRISWFDAAGRLTGSRPFAVARPEPPTPDAIIASGGALGVTPGGDLVGYALSHADPVQQAGVLPLWGDLQLLDTASTPLRPIGRFTLVEWYEDPSLEGFPIANRMETPVMHWAGRDELMAIAAPDGHRVDVLEDGARASVIVESRARLPFTPDSIPAAYDLAADSLPAYRDVRIDAEHRIWVQPAVIEGTPSVRWRVFGPAGDRLGDLELPADAILLDATSTWVLLLRRSELDEESVELRGLRPPER